MTATPHRITQEDYRVQLDAYAGPLDLLLYLVKRDEIDLHDIPIARLTEQYLEHLKLIQQIDIDLAGEFLVMAATLLEIKSAMLAPPLPNGGGEGDETPSGTNPLDPRYELVQQLLAYKRFKDAAYDLEDRYDDWRDRFAHQPGKPASPDNADGEDDDQAVEIDLEDAHVLDLCEAFARILETVGQGPGRHEVVYDDTPISLHAEDLLDRLQRETAEGKPTMTLQQVFVGRKTRVEMIGLFLAVLELTRQRKIKVVQDKVGGEIRLELVNASAEPETTDKPDWRNPQTGEVEYDWPSEEARKRAERRAQLRLARARGQQVDDDEDDADPIPSAESDAPPAAAE
ncbi:MAG: hypothetical protein GC164_02775 [Phycisphaera sp.]|nr:hypothetical protein [Phycisphaera sp.]